MRLSEDQIRQYREVGYLLFEGLLDTAEVEALRAALPEVMARTGPEVIREQDGTGARLVFGTHLYSEPFRRLSLLPRLLEPCRQLLEDEVYLHQSRLNPKEGFGSGARWDWHQDYSAWQRVDGMQRPDCIMASVFIDDCSVARSPLLVIPRSHRHGFIDSIELHRDARGYSLYELDRHTVARLAGEHGIEPLIGGAGTAALVDCNLIHGSANNISPWRRAILYLIYNRVRQRLHQRRPPLVPEPARLHPAAGDRGHRPGRSVSRLPGSLDNGRRTGRMFCPCQRPPPRPW